MISFEALITLLLITSFLIQYQNTWFSFFLPVFFITSVGMFAYIVFDYQIVTQKKEIVWEKLKQVILLLLIFLIIIGGFLINIYQRHQTKPELFTHDIVIQTESAVKFLLQGKNPYKETFFDTPLAKWEYKVDGVTTVNPALYHFIMPPFNLLLSTISYVLVTPFLGWYDNRFLSIFSFLGILVLSFFITPKIKDRLLLLSLISFNPAFAHFLIEGRNDVIALFWLILALLFLARKNLIVSSVILALAFATKQTVWPIFPFFITFLWFRTKKTLLSEKFTQILKLLLPFITVSLMLFLPFFLLSPQAFFDSMFKYVGGGLQTSHQISGFGFSKFLLSLNFMNSQDYYPFWIWQLAFGLPILLYLLKRQRDNNTIGQMLMGYGIFTFVYWFFSRYFYDSHFVYLSIIFIFAHFFEKSYTKTNAI